jgi:hypothetical protein
MGLYSPTDVATHQFTIRADGVLTDADSTPTGSLFVDGSFSGAATVTNLGVGRYKVEYTVPAGSENADLVTEVDAAVSGHSVTHYFHDQINTGAGGGGGASAEDIADEVLSRGVVETITNVGTIDRHSLSSLVLMSSNATSVPGVTPTVDILHPDTDVAIHSYQITVGPGCPVTAIT